MNAIIEQTALRLDAATGAWRIEQIHDPAILGPVDYGLARYLENRDSFTFGGGLLAGSRIPGARRLVFAAYSPAWQGFYTSSLGGGAYVFHRTGLDYVCIEGQCPTDSILILNRKNGQLSITLEPLTPDEIWAGYQGQIGYYALQRFVFDKYKHLFDGDWLRVLATGPGARHTDIGSIGSAQVRRGELTFVDDWAGRGGLGSRLLQHHRIAAIIYGGDWDDPDLQDSRELDSYFQEKFGLPMIKADLALAEKYRYVPEFETGGTFGVNMELVDDNLLAFNCTSIYLTDHQRRELHERLIRQHYLAQFNREIIQAKGNAHCGEPCGVACKKMYRHFKKDYEPYQALGPQCGIFDQRAAEQLNHYVDAMGVDAIEMGGLVAWIMELLDAGLVPPQDLGLPPAGPRGLQAQTPGLEGTPRFICDPDYFDVVADSQHNAELAQAIVEMIIYKPQGEPFRQGIRAAAHALTTQYPIPNTTPHIAAPRHRAVYLAHGQRGHMVPNQYWTPGMLGPMPIMGKYFEYYGVDFTPPRALGKKNVQRMVKELYSENGGVCRFHRKWSEKILPDIINRHYHTSIDYEAHHRRLAARIFELQEDDAVFWESARVVDLLAGFLEKWERFGLVNDELEEWVERFRADRWAAARAWWDELRAGAREELESLRH